MESIEFCFIFRKETKINRKPKKRPKRTKELSKK